jgi:hypothetical protein
VRSLWGIALLASVEQPAAVGPPTEEAQAGVAITVGACALIGFPPAGVAESVIALGRSQEETAAFWLGRLANPQLRRYPDQMLALRQSFVAEGSLLSALGRLVDADDVEQIGAGQALRVGCALGLVGAPLGSWLPFSQVSLSYCAERRDGCAGRSRSFCCLL